MLKNKNNPNLSYSFLKQIIIVAVLSSLSIVLKGSETKFFGSIPFYIRKFLFLDFVSLLPFLFIPLYISNNNASKFLVFFGVSCSEALGFFLLRKKNLPFSFFSNFTYSICWGFLPNFFLKKNYSFLKTYFLILLLFIFHYVFVTLLGMFVYYNWLTDSHKFMEFFFGSQKRYYFIIRFFYIPIVSFVVTFLYLCIKYQLMMLEI